MVERRKRQKPERPFTVGVVCQGCEHVYVRPCHGKDRQCPNMVARKLAAKEKWPTGSD